MTLRPSSAGQVAPAAALEQLVYELLDAHADTVRLAEPLRGELEWDAHLDYLRDLQRVARGLLAARAPAPRAPRRAAPAHRHRLTVRRRIRFQPTTPRTR